MPGFGVVTVVNNNVVISTFLMRLHFKTCKYLKEQKIENITMNKYTIRTAFLGLDNPPYL